MNADGTAKYPEFQVNGTSGNAQARPAVAVGSDDRIVTVWQSNLQDGSLEGVYGRIHVAPGAAATSEVLIPQTTALSQTNPDFAIYKAGHRIVVTWTGEVQIDASTTDTRIFARIFDEDLVPVTNEFQVTNSGTTVVGQNNSAVAVTGSVGFVVAFEDYPSTAANAESGIAPLTGTATPSGRRQSPIPSRPACRRLLPSSASTIPASSLHGGRNSGTRTDRLPASQGDSCAAERTEAKRYSTE